MALFQFEVLDSKGRYLDGSINAPNESDAVDKLKLKGYKIISLEGESGWSNFKQMFEFNKMELNDKQTVQFLKELKSVLRTGIKPLECMDYLSQNAEDAKFIAKVSLSASQAMQSGNSLSESLAISGIPTQYTDVLSVGDSTGNMFTAIDSVIDQIELSIETKKGFSTVFVAPAVTGGFMILGTIAAILWMIPLQEKIIYQLVSDKADVPPFSAAAFWFGDWGIPLIIGFLALIVGFITFRAVSSRMSRKMKRFWGVMALNTPIFGSFHRNLEYSRISSMLMLAMSSGGRQDEVLALIKDQTDFVVFQDKLNDAYLMVKKQGYLISQAFEEVKLNGIIISTLKRGEKASKEDATEMVRVLAEEFANKSLYNMEVLKGASEVINQIFLLILSIPILLISVAPSIDQVTLMMDKL